DASLSNLHPQRLDRRGTCRGCLVSLFESPGSERTLMADTLAPPIEQRLRWFQGVPRYAWLVLIIAALGWMLDCTDQHLFNLVRPPSVTELLKGHVPATSLDATVKDVGAQITGIFLLGWAAGG